MAVSGESNTESEAEILPTLFSVEEHSRVTRAVIEAEKLTAAEIVPVVAAESGRYDRAEDLCGVILGLVAMSVAWFVWTGIGVGQVDPASIWLWVALLVAFLAGFMIGAAIASRVGTLRLLFTPRDEMIAEVDERARAIFFDQRIRQTVARTGVMLYLSLYEHRAEILADESVLNVLGQEGLDELCADLTQRVAKEGVIAALCAVIAQIGERLAKDLPRQEDDRNELTDALVEIP